MSKSELLEHCAYRRFSEAVVYDWTRLYRNQNVTGAYQFPGVF